MSNSIRQYILSVAMLVTAGLLLLVLLVTLPTLTDHSYVETLNVLGSPHAVLKLWLLPIVASVILIVIFSILFRAFHKTAQKAVK